MGAGLLGLQLKCGCEGRQEWSVLATEGQFGAQNAPASQTLMVSSLDPDTIVVPSGENATELMNPLWALVFSATRASDEASVSKRRLSGGQLGCTEVRNGRSPQTLIVWSHDPDTMVVPSGENVTDATMAVFVLVFSALSSSVAAREGKNGQLRPGKGDLGLKTHLRPRL